MDYLDSILCLLGVVNIFSFYYFCLDAFKRYSEDYLINLTLTVNNLQAFQCVHVIIGFISWLNFFFLLLMSFIIGCPVISFLPFEL